MRFADIPQFVECNGYRIDVSLGHMEEELRSWIEESHLKLNPDFQRGHVWTELQQIRFVEFLLRGGRSSRECYFNHPNWHRNPTEGEFVCVDGLQRITACMRFLHNEIPVFGAYRREYEDRLPLGVGLVFMVNELKTRKEVLQWYYELNSGGTVHSEAELERVRHLIEEA